MDFDEEEILWGGWFVILLLIAALYFAAMIGCGAANVNIPPTPEGNACRRECMAIYNVCSDPSLLQRIWMQSCHGQNEECLMGCPGATR